MLLHLYFLYEKSPKKCNEIKEVVENLKMCLEESEMPNKHGIKPSRACATRCVCHKVNRSIERYGVYLAHLKAHKLSLRRDSQMILCLLHGVLKKLYQCPTDKTWC